MGSDLVELLMQRGDLDLGFEVDTAVSSTPRWRRSLAWPRSEKTAVTAEDLAELTAAAQGIAAPPDDTRARTGGLALWDFIFMQRRLYPYDMTEDEQREWDSNRTLPVP